MSINFMHVGGAFALVGTALMVKNQLDDENYESAGYVLFEIAGVQIDLKIWLPLLIAIPLFLLGQVLATAKKTTEASPSPPAATYEIEEIEEELEVSEEEEMDESEEDDEADLIARIEARTVSGRKAAIEILIPIQRFRSTQVKILLSKFHDCLHTFLSL